MLTGQRLDDHVRETSSQLAANLSVAISLTDDPVTLDDAIGDALQSCLDGLALSGCWGPANHVPSSLLWSENQRLLKRGSLQSHARQKPLGYAGDFQLLDRICRRDLTDDPLGQPMDRFFQAQAAPEAVRNRYRMIASIIAEKYNAHDARASRATPFRVTSVGSGPGWDIDWAFKTLSDDRPKDDLHVTLVDLDPRSLEFCQARLHSQIADGQLRTIQANLGRLPRLKNVLAELEGSDLIYCAGFFDYLNDDNAITMLQALWNQVAPGGELIVFNFDQENPSRAYMEWIGNWYLNYRTSTSFRDIADRARLDGADFQVGVEEAGVNLFLRCRK